MTSIVLQLFAIGIVLAGCFSVLSALPVREGASPLSRTELLSWMKTIGTSRAGWLVRLNIAGTVISFSTVVLFFMGNAKLFGGVIVAPILSLLGGALVTQWLTRRIARLPDVKVRMASSNPAGAFLAAVLWKDCRAGRTTSWITYIISLLNLSGVIWLEFALFADIGGRLLTLSVVETLAVLFIVAWAVLYSCLRYGLRGVALLDIILTPMILLGAIALLIGFLLVFGADIRATDSLLYLTPLAPTDVLWLFVLHVLCLNPFLLVVTEGHWFRYWAFGEPEIKQQVPAFFVIAAVSIVLAVAGLLSGSLLSGSLGDALIVRMLQALDASIGVFAPIFWLAGIAALFSTADSQLLGVAYAISFNPQTGTSSSELAILKRPFLFSTVAALAIVILYWLIRIVLVLPFDKLVFAILPGAITLLPALVFRIRGVEINAFSTTILILGILGYAICSVVGMFLPSNQLAFNLLAVVIPVALSTIAWSVRTAEHPNE